MEQADHRLVLTFDHVTGGWRPFDVAEPVGFTIAGADKKFVPAKAAIAKDGRIEVWSDAVPEPVAVRYARADNPICNMYSGAGLPLTPFRTDDFSGITAARRKCHRPDHHLCACGIRRRIHMLRLPSEPKWAGGWRRAGFAAAAFDTPSG